MSSLDVDDEEEILAEADDVPNRSARQPCPPSRGGSTAQSLNMRMGFVLALTNFETDDALLTAEDVAQRLKLQGLGLGPLLTKIAVLTGHSYERCLSRFQRTLPLRFSCSACEANSWCGFGICDKDSDKVAEGRWLLNV